ncbi:hypothetical protein PL335_05470 [Sulfitobacter faviae]|uniref:hypothetical protein n=1 Tax=Sulfitobacter faviae TaxID=1775881 RepID=UPI002308095D|nr:hypothetical protein [Sulfitobacter faviae]WCE67794.1 hypothetical protein PL335_05470 [Sulfitobacter faviae]
MNHPPEQDESQTEDQGNYPIQVFTEPLYRHACSGPAAPQDAKAGPLEEDAVLDEDVTPLNHAAQAVAPLSGQHS